MKLNNNVKFFDKNIIRKSDLSDKNMVFFNDTNILMPSVFEISNSGICNRKCSFCPRSDPDFKEINKFIDYNLYLKFIDELSDHKYSGTIIFSGYVEPLLHKRIYSDISYARMKLPNVNLELITNGDPLNDERTIKLFDSGLSILLISAYDGPDQVKEFENMMERTKIDKKRFIIRKRYYSENKDFGLTISNRAGNLVNAKYKIPPLTEPLSKRCNYPFYTFFIDYNGDVQMCSHDWGKKMILGNLKNESIKSIWCSKKFQFVRKKLIKGERNFSPCNVCDVKGEFIGIKHADYWEKNNV
jgi:radical SAM protein with 4Fe4S-binding SPASM domain